MLVEQGLKHTLTGSLSHKRGGELETVHMDAEDVLDTATTKTKRKEDKNL